MHINIVEDASEGIDGSDVDDTEIRVVETTSFKRSSRKIVPIHSTLPHMQPSSSASKVPPIMTTVHFRILKSLNDTMLSFKSGSF